MSFDKCITHICEDVEHFYHPRKVHSCPFPHTEICSDFFQHTLVLSFLECHKIEPYSSLSFETEFFYRHNAFEISVIVCINSLSLFIAVIRVCLSIFTQRHLDRCLFGSIMNKYVINIHAQVFIFGQKFLFL